MAVFIFSVLDGKRPFWTNLVQKMKIVSLSQNLVLRLTPVCRIQWWCSFFFCNRLKTRFLGNYLDLSKVSKMNHNFDLPKVGKMSHDLGLPKVSYMTHNFELPKVRKTSSLKQSALKSIHLRRNHSAVPKTNNYIKIFFSS